MNIVREWSVQRACADCEGIIEVFAKDIRFKYLSRESTQKEFGFICVICGGWNVSNSIPKAHKTNATPYSASVPITELIANDGPTKTTYREAQMGVELGTLAQGSWPINGLDNPSPV